MSENQSKQGMNPTNEGEAIGDQTTNIFDMYQREPQYRYPHAYPAYLETCQSTSEPSCPSAPSDVQYPAHGPQAYHSHYYNLYSYRQSGGRSIQSESRHPNISHHSREPYQMVQYSDPGSYLAQDLEFPVDSVFSREYDPDLRTTGYSSEAMAASIYSGYFPGTSPREEGDGELATSMQQEIGRLKTEEGTTLHPNEGFDSPDSNYGLAVRSTFDLNTASIPNSIYLNSDSMYTQTPDTENYETPVSTRNQTHCEENAPPSLPIFHQPGTKQSTHSSTNSSSYGASSDSSNDFGWARHFNSLMEYKRRHGDCEVPQKHKEGDVNLGVWVNKVSI